MDNWISTAKNLPEKDQAIEVNLPNGTIELGVYIGDGNVAFDFWSGTAVCKFDFWKPRVPTGFSGHPYTRIARMGK
jgi:hypothetical protein